MDNDVVHEKVHRRSLIKQYFTDELYLELLKISMITGIDNDEKGLLIKAKLKEFDIPHAPLGSGTNRFGIQIDGFAVKIALDKDGMIDNRREFKYSMPLQPYVVKVYESTPTGLLAVSEYVNIFDKTDFQEHKDEMRAILADISNQFLIGDVGITERNYINWGKRGDGSICILDFAYIYDVKFNTFACNCDHTTLLLYDSNFVNLICPRCGRKYSFGEIRRRITRKSQEEEIGDIRNIGYCLTSPVQEFSYQSEFEYHRKNKEEKVKKPSRMDKVKALRKQLREREENANPDNVVKRWDED